MLVKSLRRAMSSRLYRYRRDKVTTMWTVVHIVAIIFITVSIYNLYVGGFFSAWFVTFVVALLLLMALSVPRYIKVNDSKLTIYCSLDVTEIELDNIVSVRAVSPRHMRGIIPIFGGCGFFGYYGHYFDFRHFRRVVIYATEWRNLVEIVDIYEDYYYLSCRDRDRFISELGVKELID